MIKRILPVVIDFGLSNVRKYISLQYNIVVVDVLRATSTIIVALAQGAKEIIPCVEIEKAEGYKKSLGALLVGERKSEIIPGFDFTNSPVDLLQAHIRNKIIAITTSTGTKLINESIRSENILVGSTLNAEAVSRRMKKIGGSWVIIGAGTREDFRPEDQVGCALITGNYIDSTGSKTDNETTDMIRLFRKNISKHIRNSLSAINLTELGRKFDVDFVINNLNQYKIVPFARSTKGDEIDRISIIL